MPHRIIWSWYTGRWWVGCYIWYSDKGTGRGHSPPGPLIVVPNVTAHPSTASVPIAVLLYNGPLLWGFNVPIKGLKTIVNVWCRQGLHAHAFGGFTLGLALRELYLGACQLRHLPLQLVRDLVALRRLHLWANELELLPSGMFNQPAGGGHNLVELTLWGNRKFLFVMVRGVSHRLDLRVKGKVGEGLPFFTSDKGGGNCFCSCSFVCLSVSKITQKRVHVFGRNVTCRQMSGHGRTG